MNGTVAGDAFGNIGWLLAPALGNPRSQNGWIGGQVEQGHMRAQAFSLINHTARDIGNHRMALGELAAHRHWQAVAQAVRAPCQSKQAALFGFEKCGLVETVMVLGVGGGFAGHHPTHEHVARIIPKRDARFVDQTVFADTGRADDKDQTTTGFKRRGH